jgi:hypothetical protein
MVLTLKDERLQQLLLKIDGAPDREKVGDRGVPFWVGVLVQHLMTAACSCARRGYHYQTSFHPYPPFLHPGFGAGSGAGAVSAVC